MEIEKIDYAEVSQVIKYWLTLNIKGVQVEFQVVQDNDKYGASVRWYVREGSIEHLSLEEASALDDYICEMGWLYD